MSAPENPFDIAAPEYAAVRPAYPAEAIDALLAALPSHPAEPRVADIGSGTGKMSALLAARGCRVEAVEPSAAMRSQMRAALRLGHEAGAGNRRGEDSELSADSGDAPREHREGDAPAPMASPAARIRLHDGSAEATGLESASLDLVVFAQSWHWVDPERAAGEAARVLAPGGVLAAVWNQMDVSLPWVHRLTRIMRSGDVHRPENPPAFGPLFQAPRLDLVTWEDAMTPEEVLRLGTTRSSYLRQDGAGRERMQANLRWYLYEHLGFAPGEPIAIPYSTLVWTARVLGV